MRVLGHRHVTGQRRLGVGVAGLGAIDHGHLGAIDGLEFSRLDGRFDAGNVEEDAGVALGRHRVFIVHTVFGVVLVGAGELAVVGSCDQVAVAINQHLPAYIHGLGIDTSEDRAVVLGVIHVLAVVRQGNREFATTEHACGVVDGWVHRIALVREDAVESLHVGQFSDLVGFHRIQADARHAAVNLVVHEDVLAVVGAVGVRRVHVVRVTGAVFEAAVGLGTQDLFGFVGDAPADQAVHVEHGNAFEQAARRQAIDPHVTRVPTRREGIVLVELAGMHLVLAVVNATLRGYRRGSWRGGTRAGLVVATCNTGDQARQRGGVDEFSASENSRLAGGNAWFLTHDGKS